VLVDVHSHFMSLAFVRHLQGRPVHPTTVVEGDLYVTHCAPDLAIRHGPPILDIGRKLQDMDAEGIDVAVLSHGLPGPDLLGGTGADTWARRINDELARTVALHPDRLAGWGTLGFGDVGRTIAEVDRCLDELGFRVLQVWSNVGGRPLDAPDVLPVLEHIAERGAPIHLHPSVPLNREGMDSAGLLLAIAFPVDTTLALVRLVRRGFFDRAPPPGVVVAHLAGVLPWLSERLTVYLGPTDQFGGGDGPARSFASRLEGLYMDTVTYGLDQLEYVHARLGAGRMLFGSDHPFAQHSVPGSLLDRLRCAADDRELIRWGNACRLLGLSRGGARPAP
jgi:predicted TIM-barrel fold metal-dependent hydrolase